MDLPIYQQICKGTVSKIDLSKKVLPENYRAFLLNWGCDADDALRDVVNNINRKNQASENAGPNLDASTYIAYNKGSRTPDTLDAQRWLERIQAEMKRFKQVELHLPKDPEAEARIEARVKETKEKCLDDAARGVTDPAEIATKYMLSATVCDAEAETERHRGENRFCGNTLIDELICEEYGGFFSRTFTSVPTLN